MGKILILFVLLISLPDSGGWWRAADHGTRGGGRAASRSREPEPGGRGEGAEPAGAEAGGPSKAEQLGASRMARAHGAGSSPAGTAAIQRRAASREAGRAEAGAWREACRAAGAADLAACVAEAADVRDSPDIAGHGEQGTGGGCAAMAHRGGALAWCRARRRTAGAKGVTGCRLCWSGGRGVHAPEMSGRA
jgi:hypothetical protein